MVDGRVARRRHDAQRRTPRGKAQRRDERAVRRARRDLAVVLAVALGAALGARRRCSALRDPVLLRLSLRNTSRRRGRSALIVVGLMLGTTIITAALATGDTMSHTIRSMAIETLGQTDEVVAAQRHATSRASSSARRRAAATSTSASRAPSAPPAGSRARRRRHAGDHRARRRPGAGAAHAPSRGSCSSPPIRARMAGFGEIRDGSSAARRSLSATAPRRGVPQRRGGRRSLRVGAGRRRARVRRGRPAASPLARARRRALRRDRHRPTAPSCSCRSPQAQRCSDSPGQIRQVLVSNRGGATLRRRRSPTASSQRLDPPLDAARASRRDASKQDAIETADAAGSAFMAFFTTFGSFSIAAGILLIFLIFVMLAAERRSELGHRPRHRHAPRPPDRAVPLRGRRLRPGGRARGRAARGGRRVRDGDRRWRARSATRASTSSTPSSCAACSSATRSACC